MRRPILFLLVAVLCATTSGLLELFVPEQCALESRTAPVDDGACAPTCLRCHCARPFDVVVPLRLVEAARPSVDWADPVQTVPLPTPHDILHVPRLAAA